VKAYVLIKVRTGEVTSVVRHLHRVKAVRTAEMTFGEFDAIAIIEAGDLEAIGTVIAAQVQTIHLRHPDDQHLPGRRGGRRRVGRGGKHTDPFARHHKQTPFPCWMGATRLLVCARALLRLLPFCFDASHFYCTIGGDMRLSPQHRLLGPAEVSNHAGIQLVGLVARQLAVGIGFDARRVHHTHLVPPLH